MLPFLRICLFLTRNIFLERGLEGSLFPWTYDGFLVWLFFFGSVFSFSSRLCSVLPMSYPNQSGSDLRIVLTDEWVGSLWPHYRREHRCHLGLGSQRFSLFVTNIIVTLVRWFMDSEILKKIPFVYTGMHALEENTP